MAEKKLNQLPPDLRRLYTKATEAAQRDNDDYALALFCQVLEKEPTLFECRQALRQVQAKKSTGSGGGFFKKMMSGAGSSPMIAKAKMTKNPAEAMAIAESVLNTDPNNSFAHRIIVDAARTLELPQTAVLSLETMVRHSPKDKSLVIEFADAVAEAGCSAAVAEEFLDALIRANSYDPELLQAQKNLSAHRTMDEGGYAALEGGEGSYRDILKDKEQAASLEQEHRVQKTEDVTLRLIEEYETRLQTEPENQKLIRSLAELYAQKQQFSKSVALYERLQQLNPSSDATLDRALSDTKVKQLDYDLAQLNPFEEGHAEKAAQITATKTAFQLTECQQRVEKYPTDLAIRFELAQLYFQAGKIGEAMAEFQKAQQNPHKRIAAMSGLAQCFAKRKMYDLAARTLQNAIKEKPAFDDEKRDLVYNLGCVLESMNKKEEAIEQFKLIYEMDISYRDVAAKVDAYYAGQ